ncbi:unnamed protein product [Aphanomyces euteiches]|nr:hypothetical protein Ae201684P_017361 [Aphanomyces euteiches]KAH9051913.1 hypothetical protein Ae201684P_017393 [Aphanomyces euteiches]
MRLTAASVLALIALTAASRSSVDGREPAAPSVEVGDVTRRLAKDPPRMRTMSAYKTQSKDKPILRPEDVRWAYLLPEPKRPTYSRTNSGGKAKVGGLIRPMKAYKD